MKNYLKLNLVVPIVLLNSSLLCDLKAQNPGPQPDPSLKLHFDFEGDFSGGHVLDVSGHGNNAWQMDSTNWITSTNGVFGSTAGFFHYVGIYPDAYQVPYSQYGAITNLNGIDLMTNATISVWAQIGTNHDYVLELLDCEYQYSPGSWTFGRDSAPYLSFNVAFGGSSHPRIDFPWDVVQAGGSYPDLSTTAFHQYAVTVEGTNNQIIGYYDGLPFQTNTLGVDHLITPGYLCLGAMQHNGTPQWGDDQYPNAGFFVGKMDDVRIYNRTLSATEVQALYHGSTYAQNLAIHKAAPQSVQVGWDANSNAVYQVEYQSNLAETAWSPLQSAIPGSVTNSITDSILGQPSRFYRVRVLP